MVSTGRSAYRDRNMELSLLSDADGVLHVGVSGRISGSELHLTTDPLKQLLGPEVYTTKVLINLEMANMVDSSGVGWLISSQRKFSQAGGMMVLHSIPPMVRSVLMLLRMDRVFNFAEDFVIARELVLRGQ